MFQSFPNVGTVGGRSSRWAVRSSLRLLFLVSGRWSQGLFNFPRRPPRVSYRGAGVVRGWYSCFLSAVRRVSRRDHGVVGRGIGRSFWFLNDSILRGFSLCWVVFRLFVYI